MEQSPAPVEQEPRGASRSEVPKMDVHLPVTEAGPSSSIWDWDDLLDFDLQDELSISFDDESLSHSSLVAAAPEPELEPERDSDPVPRPGRVRKRDPRLTCTNFLAGRVPCECPEIDEQIEKLQEVEVEAPVKKRTRSGRVGSGTYRCQVPGCEADISELKGYHRRHRICLRCANSSTVLIDGETKRYCQQCGKFHMLSEFDEGKRSCRWKLEHHNIKRREKLRGSKTAVKKRSQGTVQSEKIACDGEAGKDDASLSVHTTEEELAIESEEGIVSPHCSAPMLQSVNNDSGVTLIETEIDRVKDDSKFSISTSCNKSAYSSVCSTGRISFKLYDWNPAEFPRRLRHQIFHWLANMPVELEAYIRPGCIILTVFISMPKNMWMKLYENPMTYIHDIVFTPGRMLYGRGFMTIHLNNMIFRTRKDGTSMVKIDVEVQAPRLHYVHPACFEAGKPMEFVACGSNLLQPKFQFLVSFAGRYLPHDRCVASTQVQSKEDSPSCDHQLYKIHVPQTDPDLFGPAFVEVENQSGLSNFVPVLIGDKEVCSEMESIQQRFDASFFPEGSNVSSTRSLLACKVSTMRQRAYSELVLDIAWLLREPKLENLQEIRACSQIQRFNCILSFLIQSDSTVILKKVLQNLKIVVENSGFNGTNDSDVRLLQKYMSCARDILSNKLEKGESPVLLSKCIEQERNWYYGNFFQKEELSVVPSVSQDSGERTDSKLQAIMASTTTSTRSETVPLLNKEIVMNVNLSKECPRNSCSPIFATRRLRPSRPTVFLVSTAAICLGMCAVLFHPDKVGEFAVTIRWCLFKRS